MCQEQQSSQYRCRQGKKKWELMSKKFWGLEEEVGGRVRRALQNIVRTLGFVLNEMGIHQSFKQSSGMI